MQLKGTAVVPASLVFMAEAGQDHEPGLNKTVRSMKDIALTLAKEKPHTIILVNKHGNVFEDAVSLDYTPRLKGKLTVSGEETAVEKECDMGLLEEINRRSGREKLPVYLVNDRSVEEFGIRQELSDASLTALYYIHKVYSDFKIVQITAGDISRSELYRIGMIVREAVEANGKSAFMITSADQSDRLSSENEGIREAALAYDAEMTENLADDQYLPILEMQPSLITKADAAGYDPIVLMLGCFEKIRTQTSVLSYETAAGTGYLCAESRFLLEDHDFIIPGVLEQYEEKLRLEKEALLKNESELIKMIRAAAALWVTEQRRLDFPTYCTLIEDQDLKQQLQNQQAGVFVTVMKNDRIRGCMGSITPFGSNIGEAFIHYTIEALSYDPRFMPVEPDELDSLTYTADILERPEDVEETDELDPSVFGLVVEQGVHRSVLLPGLPDITTAAQQIEQGKEKAGINRITQDDTEPLILQRFRTEHFS